MQTPSCPACGSPLRWFPEMNAWGCDRCQQMFPAAPPMHGGMQGAPGQRTQAEKTRTMILGGALVIAIIGVAIMLATDDKESGAEESDVAATAETEAGAEVKPTTPTPTTPTPTTPTPTTPTPTTPKGSPINIPECAEVATLRSRVEACAAIPENIRTTLYQDADNKMSVFDVAPPSGDYAEMVRDKCAGTARSLSESLAEHACK